MIKSKLNIICILALTFSLALVSCKKDDDNSKGTCTDGFLNNGEESTDCGGPCAPCKAPLIPSVQAMFWGKYISTGNPSFGNGAVNQGPNWVITASNDSINMSFNFGVSAIPGQHNIVNGTNTFVKFKNVVYDQVISTPSSYVVITENNTSQKYISGNFKFYLRSTANLDTLKVENGDFTDLIYQ